MERELEAIALAVANADPRLIPVQIQRAYFAGATVPQVLTAVEVGSCLAEVPAAVLDQVRQSVADWAWIARRAGAATLASPHRAAPTPHIVLAG